MHRPFLVGDRLYLRPLDVETDLDRCLDWINDPELQARIGRRHPMSKKLEQEWFERQYKSEDHINLAIVLKDGDRHVGNCGFNAIDYVNRAAEFGILLAERDTWGQGYGPEAARLILAYGFEELGLHRVWLWAFSFNQHAIRAYEKAGFTHEGVLREAYYRRGEYHDHVVMSVLESEWRRGEEPGSVS